MPFDEKYMESNQLCPISNQMTTTLVSSYKLLKSLGKFYAFEFWEGRVFFNLVFQQGRLIVKQGKGWDGERTVKQRSLKSLQCSIVHRLNVNNWILLDRGMQVKRSTHWLIILENLLLLPWQQWKDFLHTFSICT